MILEEQIGDYYALIRHHISIIKHTVYSTVFLKREFCARGKRVIGRTVS